MRNVVYAQRVGRRERATETVKHVFVLEVLKGLKLEKQNDIEDNSEMSCCSDFGIPRKDEEKSRSFLTFPKAPPSTDKLKLTFAGDGG